ncbi:uncharacterized protein LOC118471098 isoform X2 [Amphiprion ocellaris]|uniref:uncharacterized protein LOC118471098 isoform X2 n=1 Tax=Amphiprion ocellaris TaxID=80972 RepID=UPI00241110BA|nr:uncharacterized protein LOC118471098 isoform X2 [Amphiprion ocellaris]
MDFRLVDIEGPVGAVPEVHRDAAGFVDYVVECPADGLPELIWIIEDDDRVVFFNDSDETWKRTWPTGAPAKTPATAAWTRMKKTWRTVKKRTSDLAPPWSSGSPLLLVLQSLQGPCSPHHLLPKEAPGGERCGGTGRYEEAADQ